MLARRTRAAARATVTVGPARRLRQVRVYPKAVLEIVDMSSLKQNSHGFCTGSENVFVTFYQFANFVNILQISDNSSKIRKKNRDALSRSAQWSSFLHPKITFGGTANAPGKSRDALSRSAQWSSFCAQRSLLAAPQTHPVKAEMRSVGVRKGHPFAPKKHFGRHRKYARN